MMERGTVEKVIEAALHVRPETVDITGGAPELNPHLRTLISALRAGGLTVQSRTNLSALLEADDGGLPEFFRDSGTRLVASLPCFQEEEVCRQRGEGSFRKSIAALRQLNALGYGIDPTLPLDLVHNPEGPVLPPEQSCLEADYRRELDRRFGIRFSRLLTITNMPIGRFWKRLRRENKHREYLLLLTKGFNCRTVPDLMCRHQICVAWDGSLYDCDFNLAMGLPVSDAVPQTIAEFDRDGLKGRAIRTGIHCFGCTAGFGSSCGGSLVS
jgi:radical SAM/Cys-rich protein